MSKIPKKIADVICEWSLLALGAVLGEVAADEDEVGAELLPDETRHAGPHAELPGPVQCGPFGCGIS